MNAPRRHARPGPDHKGTGAVKPSGKQDYVGPTKADKDQWSSPLKKGKKGG